jgi:ABC-type multidrug transport system permease subunit
VVILTAAGCSLGFFCSNLFKEPGKVAALTNIVIIPMMILSGLFVKLTSMPVWIRWLQYITPFRYGFQLIIVNEYQDEMFNGYNYREDLGYTMSYTENMLILSGLTIGFFIASFLLLKYNSDRIVA